MARTPAEMWEVALNEAAALRPFQEALNDMPTAAERKLAVIESHCLGLLSKEDTQLLFDVYDLATA